VAVAQADAEIDAPVVVVAAAAIVPRESERSSITKDPYLPLQRHCCMNSSYFFFVITPVHVSS
jgi:hypothetical protein